MSQHESQVRVHRPAEDVEALFSSEPTDWMLNFLVLAARSVMTGSSTHHPGHRLGRPARLRSGDLALALSWSPRTGPPLFTRFNGQLLIALPGTGISAGPDGDTLLRLTGRCVGGSPEDNARVVGGLLDLLSAALSGAADQVADG